MNHDQKKAFGLLLVEHEIWERSRQQWDALSIPDRTAAAEAHDRAHRAAEEFLILMGKPSAGNVRKLW